MPGLVNEAMAYSGPTFTVDIGGKYYLLPAQGGGRSYSQDEAIQMFQKGTLQPVGVFPSREEANLGALQRTPRGRNFGR